MHDSMKSVVALFTGVMAVALLSIATDSLVFGSGQGVPANGLYITATVYRCLYAVIGGFVAAQLAPKRPLLHALLLGVIGTALAIAGSILMADAPGPRWYPVALIVTALPSAWLGGLLQADIARRSA